jgi:hypothetical protein
MKVYMLTMSDHPDNTDSIVLGIFSEHWKANNAASDYMLENERLHRGSFNILEYEIDSSEKTD